MNYEKVNSLNYKKSECECLYSWFNELGEGFQFLQLLLFELNNLKNEKKITLSKEKRTDILFCVLEYYLSLSLFDCIQMNMQKSKRKPMKAAITRIHSCFSVNKDTENVLHKFQIREEKKN